MVVVYSKPNCQQCRATYTALDGKGIQYEVKDLTKEPEALERFKARGFLQAPIVETDDEVWFGFRPDLIGTLASGKLVAAA